MCEFGVEWGWTNTIRWIYGQFDSGMGGHVKGVDQVLERACILNSKISNEHMVDMPKVSVLADVAYCVRSILTV